MTYQFLIFSIGLVVLLWSADKLVDSASSIALDQGLSTFFVGVTVVSIGTSIPEIAVTVFSTLEGAGDLVVGNIIGSEIAQITLAVGVVSLIRPMESRRQDVMVYGFGMLSAMALMLFVLHSTLTPFGTSAVPGHIARFEGLVLVLIYGFFLYMMYQTRGGEEIVEGLDIESETGNVHLYLLLGLCGVPIGAHLLVGSGVQLAQTLGVPEFLVGQLTGLGTTLPEITVASVAAWYQRGGISAGSLLGSNITDPLLSLGIGGLVSDIQVVALQEITTAGFYMILVSLAVVVRFSWKERIDRPTAVACLLLYLPSLFI